MESEVTQKWTKCSSKLTVQYPINPFSTNVPLESLALLLVVAITQSHLWVFGGIFKSASTKTFRRMQKYISRNSFFEIDNQSYKLKTCC